MWRQPKVISHCRVGSSILRHFIAVNTYGNYSKWQRARSWHFLLRRNSSIWCSVIMARVLYVRVCCIYRFCRSFVVQFRSMSFRSSSFSCRSYVPFHPVSYSLLRAAVLHAIIKQFKFWRCTRNQSEIGRNFAERVYSHTAPSHPLTHVH